MMQVKTQGCRDTADTIIPAVIFLSFFAFYLFTLTPKFLFDDNPEFIASAHVLGVTHPPGYPLLSLIGKLFSRLIPAEIPFSVNTVSAFLGALAVLMFYFIGVNLGFGKITATVGTLLLGISKTFWSQAIEAEVYAPNLFFTALSLLVILRIREREDIKKLLLLAVVLTAGIVIHYSIAILIPLYAVYLLFRVPLKRIAVIIPVLLLVFLLFFSATLYLPIRSAASPPIYWGTPEKWHGFIEHIRGVQTLRGANPVPLTDKVLFLANYAVQLSTQFLSLNTKYPLAMILCFAIFFSVFFILGVIFLIRKNRQIAILLLSALILNLFVFIFFLNYLYSERAIYVVSVFYIPSYFLLTLIFTCGLQQADTFMEANRIFVMTLHILVPVLIILAVVANYKSVDESRNLIAYQYGMNILDTMERNGVLFSPIEVESFPIAVLRTIYGQRKDIQIYGHHGTRAADVYFTRKMDVPYQDVKTLSAIETHILTTQINSIPIYYTLQRPFINSPQYALLPDGLIYRLNPPKHEIVNENPMESYKTDGVSLKNENYDYVTRSVVSKYYLRRAERLILEGKQQDALKIIQEILRFNPRSRFLHATAAGVYLSLGDLGTATDEYEKALAVLPEHVEISIDTVAIYTNLSYLYGKMGRQQEALKMIEKAAQLAPAMPLVQLDLGQTYWHMNKCEKAVETLKTAARLGVKTAPLFNILGICYEKLNNLAEAEINYKRSIELDPEYPDVYRDIGVFYAYKKQDAEKAIPMLERYLQLAPDTPDKFQILVNIAIMNYHLDRCEPALDYFQRALNENPGAPSGKLAIIHSLMGDCYETLNEPAKAIQNYKKTLELNPSSPERIKLEQKISNLQNRIKK